MNCQIKLTLVLIVSALITLSNGFPYGGFPGGYGMGSGMGYGSGSGMGGGKSFQFSSFVSPNYLTNVSFETKSSPHAFSLLRRPWIWNGPRIRHGR